MLPVRHWKLPERHVDVFHPSFVIDTVHNVLQTRTVLQCLPTHFMWVIIRIISILRAAIFQNCTCRNRCRCFAWQSPVCLSWWPSTISSNLWQSDCLCRKTDHCYQRNPDLSCGFHPWIDCVHRKVRNGPSETCHRYLRNCQQRHSRSGPYL